MNIPIIFASGNPFATHPIAVPVPSAIQSLGDHELAEAVTIAGQRYSQACDRYASVCERLIKDPRRHPQLVGELDRLYQQIDELGGTILQMNQEHENRQACEIWSPHPVPFTVRGEKTNVDLGVQTTLDLEVQS